MSAPVFIGIAGGTASGKSTIVHKIRDYFQEDILVIFHDNYYKPYDDLTLEERSNLNYDHPDSFDTELLIEDLKKLKKWKSIQMPIYDYKNYSRLEERLEVYPKKIIIVEGILILENEELRNLLDLKFFVEADSDVRLQRRILRDVKERKRTIDSVLNQYFNTVKPMFEKYIGPSKKYSDLIIPEGGENTVAIEILIEHIQYLLNKS